MSNGTWSFLPGHPQTAGFCWEKCLGLDFRFDAFESDRREVPEVTGQGATVATHSIRDGGVVHRVPVLDAGARGALNVFGEDIVISGSIVLCVVWAAEEALSERTEV